MWIPGNTSNTYTFNIFCIKVIYYFLILFSFVFVYRRKMFQIIQVELFSRVNIIVLFCFNFIFSMEISHLWSSLTLHRIKLKIIAFHIMSPSLKILQTILYSVNRIVFHVRWLAFFILRLTVNCCRI